MRRIGGTAGASAACRSLVATYIITRANWLERLLRTLALVFLNESRDGCAPVGWITCC
jgi:hypothetical protein